jgi:cysteine-rich repeat protein
MKAYEWFGVVLVSLSALGCGAVCGDGELSKGEACDDGNVANADGCEADCSLPACGNGIVDPGELCFEEQRFSMATPSDQITSGDLNQDELPDLAMVDPSSDAVTVFFNQGAGVFNEQTFALPAGGGPQDVLLADFSGDGLLDLVTANEDTNDVSILLNAQNQPFTQEIVSTPGGNFPRNLSAKDLDGVNGTDLVLIVNDAGNTIGVLLNDGTGALTVAVAPQLPNNGTAIDLAVEDVDKDGEEDLLVLDSNFKLQVFFGAGVGQFEAPVEVSAFAQIGEIGVGDVNEDGFQDVLINTSGAEGNLVIFLNQQDRSFVLDQTFVFALQSQDDFFVVDFDNDGFLDVVSPRVQQGIDVCLGQGEGLFLAPTNLPATSDVGEIVVVDLNEDEALEVAFTDTSTSELVVLLTTP